MEDRRRDGLAGTVWPLGGTESTNPPIHQSTNPPIHQSTNPLSLSPPKSQWDRRPLPSPSVSARLARSRRESDSRPPPRRLGSPTLGSSCLASPRNAP